VTAHRHRYSAEALEEQLQHKTKAALEAAFSSNWKQRVIVSKTVELVEKGCLSVVDGLSKQW
jgi:hypothetical protein